MKKLFFAALMLFSLPAFAQTSADIDIRDSLFNDNDFRRIVYHEMYEISQAVTSDTTDYAISVRPFFDRFQTAPENQRGYFVDMLTMATLSNGQSAIDLGSGQPVEDQVEFILKTLGVWQNPVNAYMRQRKGVYAFPLDLTDIEARLQALEDDGS